MSKYAAILGLVQQNHIFRMFLMYTYMYKRTRHFRGQVFIMQGAKMH